jgi:hypothetical protein
MHIFTNPSSSIMYHCYMFQGSVYHRRWHFYGVEFISSLPTHLMEGDNHTTIYTLSKSALDETKSVSAKDCYNQSRWISIAHTDTTSWYKLPQGGIKFILPFLLINENLVCIWHVAIHQSIGKPCRLRVPQTAHFVIEPVLDCTHKGWGP